MLQQPDVPAVKTAAVRMANAPAMLHVPALTARAAMRASAPRAHVAAAMHAPVKHLPVQPSAV